MTNERLEALLTDNGVGSVEIAGTDGGSMLAVTSGARVLRLTGRSGQDFLWINDALLTGDAPKLFTAGWINLGGDRTWIAPESDVFISDLNDPWNTYQVPRQFDPGSYEIHSSGSGSRISGRFNVRNFRLGGQVDMRLEKTITAASNPLRYLPDAGDLLDAEYIGYDQTVNLELCSEPMPGAVFGLWHLAQVPAGGEMLIPVTDPIRPHVYFGSDDPERIKTEPGLVRFKVDVSECRKIGIKAAYVMGRAGFLRYDCGDVWTLLIRNFCVNPSLEYIDTPWDNLADRGYAMQCYSDDGKHGGFGELEHHAPGIGDGTGTTSYTDRSQLWAFRGTRSVIQQIAKKMLGIDT